MNDLHPSRGAKLFVLPVLNLLLCALLPTSVTAATITVDPSGTYNTVQKGINAAKNGDTVEVIAGTYYEIIDFKGKRITLRGIDGADSTVIDANGVQGPVVSFIQGEDSSTLLEGFTLTGAFSATINPGGINVLSSSPRIRNVLITGNTGYSGGGIYIAGGEPLFESVRIEDNAATLDGGGVYIVGGSPEFSNCTVARNDVGTTGKGGGIAVAAGSPYFHNSIVGSNEAYYGGGIFIFENAASSSDERIRIYNNLFTSNKATLGGNVYLELNAHTSIVNNVIQIAAEGGGVFSVQEKGEIVEFEYNDVFDEQPKGAGSAIDPEDGPDNINMDPLFVSFSPDSNFSNDDLHLQVGSPCSDMGSPDLTDPDGSRSDIGYYGGPDDPEDSDGDGMSDAFEYAYDLDPEADDSEGDADADGLSNLVEFQLGTDPTSTDSDMDGASDGEELSAGDDPADPSDNQPTAEAGPDQFAEVGQLVVLDGSASTDPNDDPLTYDWHFESLPEASSLSDVDLDDAQSVSPSFTIDAEGSYTLSLVVNDGKVDSTPDTVTVHVNETINVPGTYATIQEAIDAAFDGDVITVSAGVYKETINFSGKSIELLGEDQSTTIIDGNNADAVALFVGGEGSDTILDGFTLRNGKVTSSSSHTSGGCVYILNSLPTLRNLTLSKCSASLNGGGLYAKWNSGLLTLENIRIEDSTAAVAGGGLYLTGGESELLNLEVLDNTATVDGGGLYLSQGTHSVNGIVVGGNVAAQSGGGIALVGGSMNLRAAFVYENSAGGSSYGGGGIYLFGSAVLEHNVFSGNVANAGDGGGINLRTSAQMSYNLVLANSSVRYGGNIYIESGDTLTGDHNVVAFAPDGAGVHANGLLEWTYNDVHGNVEGDYQATSDLDGVDGNIDEEPGFLAWSDDGDATNDRFNLSSDSALIDAGDKYESDVDGSVSDIGLYGGDAGELDMDWDGVSFGEGDCDDWTDAVPASVEVWDGLDQDCDGEIDEGTSPDVDQDGWSIADGDCDDNNAEIYPGALEVRDDVDNNCNGQIDEAVDPTDVDGDGHTVSGGDCDDSNPSIYPGANEVCSDGIDQDCTGADLACGDKDNDHDGYTVNQGDCDDSERDVYPGAPEVLDQQDNDCDGETDEVAGDSDLDADGMTPDEGDCDDLLSTVYDGAPELADGLDNDCDGETDEGTADDDGDGYSEGDGDCDDTDPQIHPGQTEALDDIDNDCDGLTDEGTVAYDDDSDGFSEDGSIGGAEDCNDSNKAIYPGANELADGKDNDCDGDVDEGTSLADDDGDGFTEEEGDCDDDAEFINPDAVEEPDGVDNNCDGHVDEDTDLADDDGDGFSESEGDCDDDNRNIHPNAGEMADGVDNNCNGEIDEGLETPEPSATPSDENVSAEFGGGALSCSFCPAPSRKGSGPWAGMALMLALLLIGQLPVRRHRAESRRRR